MISDHRPYIAREGWVFILFAVVCAWLVQASAGVIFATPLWLLTALLVYVFRDPDRKIPSVALAVVSPADGRIMDIEKIIDPILERNAIAIRIRMQLSGPYVIRSPIEGKVTHQWLGEINSLQQIGGTDRLKEDASQSSGQYHAIQIQSDEGDNIVLMLTGMIPGFRPRFFVHPGIRIGQGQRCGFINFGCSVLVLIPDDSRQEVTAGSMTIAGTEIIATLIHN